MTTVQEIKTAFQEWFSKEIGQQHVFRITFDADFVPGNQIDGSFDGDAIFTVDFETDQETTLKALAAEIQATAAIFEAKVTGAREITVTGLLNGNTIAVVGPTVSGGASQPNATTSEVTAPAGIPVIYADQAAPRPAKPYGTIRLGVQRDLGLRDEFRELDELGVAEYLGQREMTVAMNIYGPGAMEQMQKAQASLSKETVLARFMGAFGIAILDAGDITNLTGFLEVSVEERAQMEVRIGYSVTTKDDVGWIETVEANDQIISIA